MDDGNFRLDKMLIDILKPAGFKGTFNLISNWVTQKPREEAIALYEGFEVANHCKRHPLVFLDGVEYKISDDEFDEQTANEDYVYKTAEKGFYKIKKKRWLTIVDTETYKRLTDEGRRELEEIFGAGSIRGYAWPYHMQNSSEVFEWLKTQGYQHIRRSAKKDFTFSMPSDRTQWFINSWYTNLPDTAIAYDELADDGNLKFYCLGTHSHDFSNIDRWDLVYDLAARLGNRPDDFYYATVSEIFDYEDAILSARITDTEIINNSNLTLYVKVNGNPVTVAPNSSYKYI